VIVEDGSADGTRAFLTALEDTTKHIPATMKPLSWALRLASTLARDFAALESGTKKTAASRAHANASGAIDH
jgi:hypothetical protein